MVQSSYFRAQQWYVHEVFALNDLRIVAVNFYHGFFYLYFFFPCWNVNECSLGMWHSVAILLLLEEILEILEFNSMVVVFHKWSFMHRNTYSKIIELSILLNISMKCLLVVGVSYWLWMRGTLCKVDKFWNIFKKCFCCTDYLKVNIFILHP